MTPTRITALICLLRRPRHPAGLPEQDGFVGRHLPPLLCFLLLVRHSSCCLAADRIQRTKADGNPSGDPAGTTQPSLSSDVNTAPITTPGDPDVTTTTTQEWVQPTAAFDPDHPLAVFRDPNYTFNRFTEEQVMAIFDAVDTVQQLMDVTQTDVNYVRELWKQEISFAFMTDWKMGQATV